MVPGNLYLLFVHSPRSAQSMLLAVIGLLALLGPVWAETVGVVLLHGKEGMPSQLEPVAAILENAGYLVERPQMCWSRRRIYDRSYLDCLEDADRAVERLKVRGATAIVVGGMSQGGQAALAYGANREGLRGIIALSPAPPIELLRWRSGIAAGIARAQALVNYGNGNEIVRFPDTRANGSFEVETTAAIYLSFVGPQSPGIMPDNAARQKAPVLIVSGVADRSQRSMPYVFARLPPHTANWHVTLGTDHLGTLEAASSIVLAWLAATGNKEQGGSKP